jgi:tetratricopeptide (TPR) repeat protein
MIHEGSRATPGRRAAGLLACLSGGVGLLVYLVTLNRWVSLSSLATLARVSGWNWQPELREPLTAIVLFPFRMLPPPWIAAALNVFTAMCAALVLALLARSVALLAHGSASFQRHGESSSGAGLWARAGIPPVLAALACGLQLSFWEHATSASGEMINLLLFAAVIWCLLEFRTERRQGWLSASVFLYAAGVSNSWTLIVYFPILLAAIVWIKGLGFFNVRFLLRLVVWGLAGLSLYLLLPCLAGVSSAGTVGFWSALKANLKFQKEALSWFLREPWPTLGLTSTLPLVVIAVLRKSSQSGSSEGSPVAAFLTSALLHIAHAAFLAVSLWLTLDPPFSPRSLALGSPWLTQYYLSALILGYCASYYLVIGGEPAKRSGRRSQRMRLRRPVTIGAFVFLLVALPSALAWRNLGQIRSTNGPALRQFARQLSAGLPEGKSTVLSDDLAQLFLLRAELTGQRNPKEALLLDTRALAWGHYQILMASQFESRWPSAPPTNHLERIEPPGLLDLVARFSTNEQVVYLHPSFGYYFEGFAEQPHGLVHYLTRHGTNTAARLPLDARLASENEQFWQEYWSGTLQSLAGQLSRDRGDSPQSSSLLARCLRLAPEHNHTLTFLGAAYSKDLNDWGVNLQRLGRWADAGLWFERALELKPDNLSAWINREWNQRRQRGDARRLDLGSLENRIPELLAKYRSWQAVLYENGPLDEPTFLFEAARVWLSGGQLRQAAMDFARCAELAPGWAEPKVGLAESQARLKGQGRD